MLKRIDSSYAVNLGPKPKLDRKVIGLETNEKSEVSVPEAGEQEHLTEEYLSMRQRAHTQVKRNMQEGRLLWRNEATDNFLVKEKTLGSAARPSSTR